MPSSGEVLISGVVTSGVTNTLTDANQVWVVGAYVNQSLYLPRTGEVLTILANTATDITVNTGYVPVIGESYAILAGAVSQQTTATQITGIQAQLLTVQTNATALTAQVNNITTATLSVANASAAVVNIPVSIP